MQSLLKTHEDENVRNIKDERLQMVFSRTQQNKSEIGKVQEIFVGKRNTNESYKKYGLEACQKYQVPAKIGMIGPETKRSTFLKVDPKDAGSRFTSKFHNSLNYTEGSMPLKTAKFSKFQEQRFIHDIQRLEFKQRKREIV